MRVRLTQIDGALPNLALMRLASWHRERGDEVVQTRQIEPDLFEGNYDRVYGSAVFKFSADRLERFQRTWPGAILGGTGTNSPLTVEDIAGDHQGVDYSGYDVDYSIGFTQRGCRLKCKFCVVPKEAQTYLDRMQEICGVPIDLISTGADREQTIVRRHPFE